MFAVMEQVLKPLWLKKRIDLENLSAMDRLSAQLNPLFHFLLIYFEFFLLERVVESKNFNSAFIPTASLVRNNDTVCGRVLFSYFGESYG